MSLPANWDRRLVELTHGCTEEEKGESKSSNALLAILGSLLTSLLHLVYHRLIVSFAWNCMLDLKKRGKLTPEATEKFLRSMDEEDARRTKEKLELVQEMEAFKCQSLDLGQSVDAWREEVLTRSGSTV